MAIITLTTDLNTKDFLVPMIKGAILSHLSGVTIVDITHKINPFDIAEAAYIIKNCFASFPEKTIHIIAVDALLNPKQLPILALVDGHYFITNNNGLLSLIFPNTKATKIVMIDFNHKKEDITLPIKDMFVPATCYIANDGDLTKIGAVIDDFDRVKTIQPQVRENSILGNVIYIDTFGNVITNITKEMFIKTCNNRKYEINVRNKIFKILRNNYTDVVADFDNEELFHGEGMALFNIANHLEIAIYKSNLRTVGGASSLFGLRLGDTVAVNFMV